jgi:hypothetical protein
MDKGKALSARIAEIDTSDPDACWIWPGKPGGRGYGRWGHRGVLVHRAVYELKVGPIPPGEQIGHTCHDKSNCRGGVECPHRMCVNWARHIRPMTARTNLLASRNTFNAANAAKDSCPQDHPYDAANTAIRNGRRHCRTCERGRQQRNYYRDLAAARAYAREYQRRKRAAPAPAA